MSYQASFTESNCSAEADLTAIPRNTLPVTNIANYPQFPLCNEANMVEPRVLTDAEKVLLANLAVDEDKIHVIESGTYDQAGCNEFIQEREYRFTASRWHQFALVKS